MFQGEVLKKLIKEKGFTQLEFANKLGVSRNYLIVLLDKKNIDQDYLNSAAKILGVNNNVFTLQNADNNYISKEFTEKAVFSLEQIALLREINQELKESKERLKEDNQRLREELENLKKDAERVKNKRT